MSWMIGLFSLVTIALLGRLVRSLKLALRHAEHQMRLATGNLIASQQQLSEVQRLAMLGSWSLNVTTGELCCSEEARQIHCFDKRSRSLTRADLLACVPEDERNSVDELLDNAVRSGNRGEIHHRIVIGNQPERWVHIVVQSVDENGIRTLHGTVLDDTQSKKSALHLALAYDVASTLLSEVDAEHAVTKVLASMGTWLEWDFVACWRSDRAGLLRVAHEWHWDGDSELDQFAKASSRLSYRPGDGTFARAAISMIEYPFNMSVVNTGFSRELMAIQAKMKSGILVPVSVNETILILEFLSRRGNKVDREMMSCLDAISSQLSQFFQRTEAERALSHIVSHDGLTGLPNRAALHESLTSAVRRAVRQGQKLAVMCVNFDRFKVLNDTLGHSAGDALVCASGERIVRCVEDSDTVARFGDDEFVVVLEELATLHRAMTVAHKVLDCFQETFWVNGYDVQVSASIGISLFPDDGADAETLTKNADAAMHRAKENGRGMYQFYSPQINAQGVERLILETGLRRALEHDELMLYYQPKMNLRTHAITGVEALIRWRHPELGIISPAVFIPIAEEIGLIDRIGKRALEIACSDACRWRQQGMPIVQVSVNLSPYQFNNLRLVEDVSMVLKQTGLDPSGLELEITESAMMQHPESAANMLRELCALGVSIAIDDFGTGYSSLSYLTCFPLGTIKIDRSFMKNLPGDHDGEALLSGIIRIAHGLRMKVIAEGVETPAQMRYLEEQECDEIQGYLLSKPVPEDEVRNFIVFGCRALAGPSIKVA